MTSDDIVESLQPYGIVRVYQNDNKTFAAVAELFMHGMKAEVRSYYKCSSMKSALIDLQGKVFELVNKPITDYKLLESE